MLFRNVLMLTKVHPGISSGLNSVHVQKAFKKIERERILAWGSRFFFFFFSDSVHGWQKFTLTWTESHYSPNSDYTPVTWLPINSNCDVPILASATGSKIPTGTYTIKPLKHIVHSLGLLDEGLIFQNEILPLWIIKLILKMLPRSYIFP